MDIKITIEKMQEIEFNLLKSFDEYCQLHDLRYYLAYGTLIGAIRHKGFIPWDDDVDVVMPRKDYEKLLEINPTLRNGQYKLITPKNRADWPYLFSKLVDTNTLMEESTYKSGKIGVYIDIFPIDGLPDKVCARKWHLIKLKYWHFLLITVQKTNLKGKTKFRSLIKRIIYPIAKIIGINNILKKIEKLITKYDFDLSKYVAVQIALDYGSRECVARENYYSTERGSFNGCNFNIPSGYNNILTSIYGDYMEFPPEEERTSHHAYNVTFLEHNNK